MINDIIAPLAAELASCAKTHDVYVIKSQYLGKTGKINKAFSSVKQLAADEKRAFIQEVNQTKVYIENAITSRLNEIELAEIQRMAKEDSFDFSKPHFDTAGSIHPLTTTSSRLVSVLQSMGFELRSGPEIETSYYNFDALNIPKYHPARAMHDTFYLSDGGLLRTQTSSVQIHVMEQEQPPFRMMSLGRVFRSDFDTTHTPMFHQLEGLVVNKTATFVELKHTLYEFVERFFGKKMQIKFRPSYFPFTEPSAEMDIFFNGRWLEVLGCGMVHPKVLKNVGLDPSVYQGFAFGLGVDRFCMLQHDIADLRDLFDNRISFLHQFRGSNEF
ncbi:MAG: phenylalanine--tRNA ligase subunit alpha [Candidatus Comchoanobacterales bacterium]